jgi:hypothetical protein
MLRFTVAAVGAGPGALETGMTPIPPLNLARERESSSADAEKGAAIEMASRKARVFVVMATP